MINDSMEQVVAILRNKQPKLCVLSSATLSGVPESAVVGYAVKDDLTLVFSTQKNTRKYRIITTNPHVSFVTGWSFHEPNIQIDGEARIVADKNDIEYQDLETFFFGQNQDAAQFKTDNTVFIILKPSWYKLLDLSVHPVQEIEKTLSL